MTRKTAAALKEQPSLLDAAPIAEQAPKPKPPATTGGKKKPGTAVSTNVESASRVQQMKNTAANTLAVIAEALKDPNFKPEAMKQVFDLQKEMVAEQARVDFIVAFHAMKKLLPSINRDGKIVIPAKDKPGGGKTTRQETPFATYPNIRKKVDPILDANGFTMWDETEPSADGARINVIVHLDHTSGHGRKTIFPLPAETSGSKNNVQGWGSSFQYGRRYGAMGLLGLVTEAPSDRDNDGNAPEARRRTVIDGAVVENGIGSTAIAICSEEQIMQIRDAIAACGVSDKTFCAHFEIGKISQLPAASFQDALAACKSYAEKSK